MVWECLYVYLCKLIWLWVHPHINHICQVYQYFQSAVKSPIHLLKKQTPLAGWGLTWRKYVSYMSRIAVAGNMLFKLNNCMSIGINWHVSSKSKLQLWCCNTTCGPKFHGNTTVQLLEYQRRPRFARTLLKKNTTNWWFLIYCFGYSYVSMCIEHRCVTTLPFSS